ncbi:MAG: F0F1 ATP synthase subunit B [Planctomycetaceae bacterium]|nr:F0F1 ATP synthase subunit B [Planctomycetaceae bacterium]
MKFFSVALLVLIGFAFAPVATSTVCASEPSADSKHEAGHDDAHGQHFGAPVVEPKVFDPENWRYDLSVYTFVVFLLLLIVLTKFAWGPVTQALDEREEGIRKNIEDAETARVRAEELLAEHAKKLDSVQDEVREIIAEARRDADHTKTEIVAAAQSEAEATRNRAVEEIERAKDQALSEIFGTMSAQVTEATEHVLGRALNDDDRGRLIDDALSQLTVKS